MSEDLHQIVFIGKNIINSHFRVALTRSQKMMKSEAYYSYEETPDNTVPDHHSGSIPYQHQYSPGMKEFVQKLKLYHEQLLREKVPLKDSIAIERQSRCQSQTSSKNEGHQEQNWGHYHQTRSRGQCETIQPTFQLSEKPRPSRCAPQTKFRQRKFRRSSKLSQPDYYRMLILKFQKEKEEDVKTNKIAFFSDDETDAGHEEQPPLQDHFPKEGQGVDAQGEGIEERRTLDKSRERSVEKQGKETVDRQGEKSVDKYRESSSVTVRSSKMKEQSIEEGEIVALELGKDKNLGSFDMQRLTRKGVQRENGKWLITWDKIPYLFQELSLQLADTKYCPQDNEHPNLQLLYNEIVDELCYRKENECSSHPIMKGRLFVIRRIMEIYAQVAPKKEREKDQDRYIRKRLTNTDRNYFQKAGLPIPPCRPTTNFLKELFSNHSFATFYDQFIHSERVDQLLLEKNEKEVKRFGGCYYKMACKLQGREMMKEMKPLLPLSYLDCRILKKEVETIFCKYCYQGSPFK